MIEFSRLFVATCFLVFIVVWTVTAFSTKRTVERGRGTWARVVVFAVVLLFALRLHDGAPFGGEILWYPTPFLAVIADFITLAGLVTMLWARFTLGRNWSAVVVLKENHELIERGPYAYVRHPIYSGALLMLLGAAILSGRASVFGTLVIIAVTFAFKARQEEELLTKHFPEAYPDYKARVQAFIPSVF